MSGLAPARVRAGEDGMTIVEVLVAMVIVLVGVLGAVSLVQTGLLSTSRTTTREQATNLARDLVERSRQVSYASMAMASAPATLRATLPASDGATPLSGPDGATFDVTRRNVVYTVTVFACSIDDPTDGAGLGDATFCAAPGGANAPGTPTPGRAAGPNVLGISVPGIAAGGSLLDTVCAALGANSPMFTWLTSVVSSVVPVSVCPQGSGAGSAPLDKQADDLRRVRVDVRWDRGGTGNGGSLAQTTLLTNPRQT